MNPLEQFREEKDHLFAVDDQSPLTDKQKHSFKGLIYYPENSSLSLEVSLKEFPQKEMVNLQTSTGDVQAYLKLGRFNFDVEGQEASLTLYANEHGLFLPFADSLAGEETYDAGRYIDVHTSGNGNVLVDFNYAYNPYCAYNERWSCPLTPAENRLQVPLRAGEKIFDSH